MPSKPDDIGKCRTAKNITDFLEWVNKLGGGRMLYRGVPSEKHEVEASICRRFSNPAKEITAQELVEKSKDLVEKARESGHDSVGSKAETDLQLLAKLQHHHAATCLIDFTSNPLVALWFACRTTNQAEKGKIFAFDAEDPDQCLTINAKQSVYSIEELLSHGKDKLRETNDMLLAWKPLHQESRIGPQQSVFVFGKPTIDVNHENMILIEKLDIHDELRRKYGISEDTLFNDFYGFASINAESRKYPDASSRGYYDMAQQYRAEQDYDTALYYYNQALKNPPYHADYYYGRGRTHAAMSNYLPAIADYKKAIKHDKEYVDAYYYLGIAQMAIGRFADAIESLNQAIQKSPNFAEAYFARGYCKASSNNFQDSIHDLDEAIRINPQFADALFERGNAYARLANYQEAIKSYDEAIRIDPQYAEIFFNRGNCNAELGDHQESINNFNEAIRINPQYTKAFYNRGNSKAKLGDYQEAIKDYDDTIRINPKHADAFHNRAICKSHLGDKQGAWTDIQEAQRLDPKLEIPEEIQPPDKDNKK